MPNLDPDLELVRIMVRILVRILIRMDWYFYFDAALNLDPDPDLKLDQANNWQILSVRKDCLKAFSYHIYEFLGNINVF